MFLRPITTFLICHLENNPVFRQQINIQTLMTKMFLGALLLTSTVCNAQPARTVENTNGTWKYPNLSVESWNDQSTVIAGSTAHEEHSTLKCPTFKLTNTDLVPITPLPTYHTVFSSDKLLMDFTMDHAAGRIIMTGTDPMNDGSSKLNMFITGLDALSGSVLFSVQVKITGYSLIPHHIIYSPANNHYVVVGTKFQGSPTEANYGLMPKKGFVLIVNATTLATIKLIETNTPSLAGSNDSDALETVTEIPAAQGGGYFAGGSANGVTDRTEQNMMVMRVLPGTWTPGASSIIDNTGSNSSASSVMFNPSLNQVIVLNNSTSSGTYELMRYNPTSVSQATPSVRHTFGACLSPGMTAAGFQLQQNPAGTAIMVGGFITNTVVSTSMIPFQTTTTTSSGLTAMINAKLFQTNNVPLGDYFKTSGTAPFNTPDIMSYNKDSYRTFLVNPSLNDGFDMLRSAPANTLDCETNCQFTTMYQQWPETMNTVSYTQSVPGTSSLPAAFASREISEKVLCPLTSSLAPGGEEKMLGVEQDGISLFPNPAKDKLEIESGNAITEAIVYDLNGGKVLEAFNSENESGIRVIDISLLKSGVYVITLKNSKGVVERRKFVKE
jgi:hypothetical protein